MAVSAVERRSPTYFGNGVATEFAYGFKILAETDLEVRQIDAAGVSTTLALATNYTVAGVGADNGGVVTLLVAPPTGERIIILGDQAFSQPLVLVNQGPYFAVDVMRALDRNTILAQQLNERLSRAVAIPPESAVADTEQLVADITTLADISADVTEVARISSTVSEVAELTEEILAVPGLVQQADADATATAADRVQTGLDRVATGADVVAAAASASQAALFDGPWLDDVAAVIADTTLNYTGGSPSSVTVGEYVRTRAEGFSYEVAAEAATDEHVTTAGGVKLYVLPGADGRYSISAFGQSGDLTAFLNAVGLTLRSFLIDESITINGTVTFPLDRTDIQIATGVSITHTPSATKGIVFSGDDCRLHGGEIIATGARDATNTRPTYSTVWFDGQSGFVTGVKFTGTPKVAVFFNNVATGTVKDCEFNGGMPFSEKTLAGTSHCAVYIDPAASGNDQAFSVSSNTATQYISFVIWGNYDAASDNDGFSCIGNTLYDIHGASIYANLVNGAVISGNLMSHCGVAINVRGRGNVVTGNTAVNLKGSRGSLQRIGISIREAEDCVVSNNTIIGDVPDGLTAITLTNLQSNTIKNNLVEGNIVHILSGDSACFAMGTSLTEICEGNTIKGNIFTSPRELFNAAVLLTMATGFRGKANKFVENTVNQKDLSYCVQVGLQDDMTFRGNSLMYSADAASAATVSAVIIVETENCIFEDNLIAYIAGGTNVTSFRAFAQSGAANANNIYRRNKQDVRDSAAVASPTAGMGADTRIYENSWNKSRSTEAVVIPSTGTWAAGDVVWNTAPTVDGSNMVIMGWVCTVGGTPGTWVTMRTSTVSPAT